MRDRLVTAFRRAIEAVLPWYDPEREAARDRRAEAIAKRAEDTARKLESYGRISVRR